MSIGLLGKKLGMARVFADDGRWIEVTLVEAGPCTVVQRKTSDTDGYEAVQLGFGERKENRTKKPQAGHFAKADVKPKKTLREFRVEAEAEYKAGDEVKVDVFEPGDRIDVSGTSKGKGFQGVIKRHGYGGGPGGHGSHFHRAPGSIGTSATPSKVQKGRPLPGQMGNKRVTVQNLEVVRVDVEKNLLAVRGHVPGASGGLLVLRKTAKGSR
jgi:large subunit ribosomal protein L3